MTSMLLNVVETGTGKGINVPGYTIAGKSGSTQSSYSSNGTTDQWFVGYTPNLVGAVWLGYDKTDSQHYLSGLSSQGVVPIFQAVMQNTLKYTKPGQFDVQSVNAILAGKKDNHSLVDKAQEIDEKLKESAKKLKDKIEEHKSKWKDLTNQLKEKWNEIRGH